MTLDFTMFDLHTCDFVWVDQRKPQGYKSDVSLKSEIQIKCILGTANTLIQTNYAT